MTTKRAVGVYSLGGVVLAVFCSLHAFSQVGAWKNYTSMQDVRAIARDGNIFWAATSGGLFSWQEGSDIFAMFTSAEGLLSTDLTAVAVDKNGDVWTGTSGGMIHVYSPGNKTWRYVPDITTTTHTNKNINSILVSGDTMLICSEFGLSVFRNRQFQFGDTYSKFGQLSGNVRVSITSAAIFGGRIWATVSDRQVTNAIASASLSNPNLLPPEAWTLQAIGQTAPKSLVTFNGRLYAGTSGGVFVLSGSTWTAVDSLAGKNIVALSASGSVLVAVDAGQVVYSLNAQNVFQRIQPALPAGANTIAQSAAGAPVIGSTSGGIRTLTAGAWTTHFPNGPASNQFISIAVDLDGVVWGATGIAPNGKGFHRFDGKAWKSFSRQNSALPVDDIWRVSVACNGDVWAGIWGEHAGAVRVPRGSDRIDSGNIFGRNVGIPPTPENANFFVVNAPVCDGRGNTWMAVMKPNNARGLAVRKADGTWNTLPALVAGSAQIFNDYRHVTRPLAVDAFDNLWIAAISPARGLASLNNRGSATDSVADFFLTSANGLPNDNVTCIVVDRDNDIWIGTESGIAIILDPSNPTRQGGVASYKPLSGVSVNAIAVDPLNQKWVATNLGAILLSRDGTQTLAQYNVENTNGRIISDEIKDIAIDAKSGTVYFGTSNGLASLTTTAAQPKESFDELLISPNPYRIPNAVPLTIDGLVENSKIKILSIDGHLVRELQTPGGRIGFWDGKDNEGKEVSSGVYIVVAFSETKVGKGKVAVLRK